MLRLYAVCNLSIKLCATCPSRVALCARSYDEREAHSRDKQKLSLAQDEKYYGGGNG